jgi:GT2 family glycosyltransferase
MNTLRFLKQESLISVKNIEASLEEYCYILNLLRVAYFTTEGKLARNLNMQISMDEKFSSAYDSISKSKFVRRPIRNRQQFQVNLVITQDITFDRYLIFKFCLAWIQRSDSSTIYCDFTEPGRSLPFEKSSWDFVYHRSLSLLAPIYLESATACSLKPVKLDRAIVKIRSLTEYVKNDFLLPSAIVSKKHRSEMIKEVSVIIPTANKVVVDKGEYRWLIRDIVSEISHYNKFSIQFVIVHNGNMTKKEMATLRSYGDVEFVHFSETKFNISKKINLGVKYAKYEALILANDDIRGMSDNWVKQLVDWLNESYVGIAVPRIHYANGFLQYAGIEIDSESSITHILGYRTNPENQGYGFSFQVPRQLDAATGVLMAIRKAVFDQVGGWDEKLAVNFNDVDFGLRVRASGFSIIFEPSARIIHLESASRDPNVSHKHEERQLLSRLSKLKLPSFWPNLNLRNEEESPSIGFDFFFGSLASGVNRVESQR